MEICSQLLRHELVSMRSALLWPTIVKAWETRAPPARAGCPRPIRPLRSPTPGLALSPKISMGSIEEQSVSGILYDPLQAFLKLRSRQCTASDDCPPVCLDQVQLKSLQDFSPPCFTRPERASYLPDCMVRHAILNIGLI